MADLLIPEIGVVESQTVDLLLPGGVVAAQTSAAPETALPVFDYYYDHMRGN